MEVLRAPKVVKLNPNAIALSGKSYFLPLGLDNSPLGSGWNIPSPMGWLWGQLTLMLAKLTEIAPMEVF